MLVIKVAAHCNLNCSYCYEYNMGDESWRSKPRILSLQIARAIGQRIGEHCQSWGHSRFVVSLHGGEPLLARIEHIAQLVDAIRGEAGNGIVVDFGMQSNGMLLTPKVAEVLATLRFSVGVSLDGARLTNDRHRVTHNGRSSFDRTIAGIQALRAINRSGLFAGLLAVIDVAADPIHTFEFLATLNPPSIDFLLPHGNWNRPPVAKHQLDNVTPYADWLIPIFDAWFSGDGSNIEIRTFEEIIEHLAGGNGALETLGLAPVSLLTIGSDGNIEGVDTMKSVYPGAQDLGLNVETHSFDDALKHQMVSMRQSGIDALCSECSACAVVQTCGGGYMPHRYSTANGFRNRSVYCSDLYKLIAHIRAVLHASVRSSTGSTRLPRSQFRAA